MRQPLLPFLLIVALALFPLALKTEASANTDEETIVWNSVKSSGNAALLRAFVETYPNGKYTLFAESLISVLEGEVPAKTVSPEASAEENNLWNKAKASGTQTDVQRYLDAYPNGRYAALARQRLSFLSNPQAETASASQGTIESTAPTVEPETNQTATLHPFDGQWRLTGKAHSFKRYQGGICQNPDSVSSRIALANGRVNARVRSKSGEAAILDGQVNEDGVLVLEVVSKNSGWDHKGKAQVKLRKNGASTSFSISLKGASGSGCSYDFSLKRLN